MNQEHIISHLREALEELTSTLSGIESNSEYDEGEFFVAMQHLYTHLNTAWNARSVAAGRLVNLSDADFRAWRSFPTDLDRAG